MNNYPSTDELVKVFLNKGCRGLLQSWELKGDDGSRSTSWVEAYSTKGEKIALSDLVDTFLIERPTQLQIVTRSESGTTRMTLPQEAYGSTAVMLAALAVTQLSAEVLPGSWIFEAASHDFEAKALVEVILAQHAVEVAKTKRDALNVALTLRAGIKSSSLDVPVNEENRVDVMGLEPELGRKLFLLAKAGGVSLVMPSSVGHSSRGEDHCAQCRFGPSIRDHIAELSSYRSGVSLEEMLDDVVADYDLHASDAIAWISAGANREMRRRRALSADAECLAASAVAAQRVLKGADRPDAGLKRLLWLMENHGTPSAADIDAAWDTTAVHERIVFVRVHQKTGAAAVIRKQKRT